VSMTALADALSTFTFRRVADNTNLAGNTTLHWIGLRPRETFQRSHPGLILFLNLIPMAPPCRRHCRINSA
jgi:hypothetical protein